MSAEEKAKVDAQAIGGYLEGTLTMAPLAQLSLFRGSGTAFAITEVYVYRVYGGKSTMFGKSYSLFNPQYVPFYRNFAGLPAVNSGEYLLRGSIPIKNITIGRWFAKPLDGTSGGLPLELYQRYYQLNSPHNIIIKKPF